MHTCKLAAMDSDSNKKLFGCKTDTFVDISLSYQSNIFNHGRRSRRFSDKKANLQIVWTLVHQVW